MPRRRPRFAALEKQFRENGGVAQPGSRLAGYIDFKKGINKIEVTKILTSAQRKRYGFGILPFGLSPAATTPKRYAAPITQYSYDKIASVGFSAAKLGYEDIDSATEQSENFYPALLRVFIKDGANTTPISGVTKKEYTRTNGATYSFPFGRTITADDAVTGVATAALGDADAEDVKKTLATIARARPGVTSVSYEPEVFKVGKQDLASPVA